MQNQHSLMYREEEREMMPMLKHFGVGVIPWGPMGGGCTSSCLQSLYNCPLNAHATIRSGWSHMGIAVVGAHDDSALQAVQGP